MLIGLLKRLWRDLSPRQGEGPAKASSEDESLAGVLRLCEAASTAYQSGALEDATQAYEAALSLMPSQQTRMRAVAMVNLAIVWRERVNLSRAIDLLRESLVLAPDIAEAHYNLGLTLYEVGEVEEAEICLDRTLEIAPEFQAAHHTRLCFFGLGRKHDPERVLAEHRRWAERFADPLTEVAPAHGNDRSLERRLTVGYVSADFKEHSVARFISPILAHHDRDRFRVIGYDNWPKSDATTARLREYCDDWRRIDSLDDRQAEDLIRADGVDILVDLSGHTTGNRLLLFARKPAPVQASWLGYMCTTGMAAMDWHITDGYLDPPGVSDGWYRERLMRIISAAAFEPHPDSPPVNALPALDRGFVRFASLNNYTKIGDEVIALWARILERVPKSRLLLVALGGDEPWMQADIRRRFERLCGDKGIGERIDVMGRRIMREYLRTYHSIDIALDPFPYGGGTTSLHTLWMGVPIITLEGDSEIARGTSGMLNACGLSELVAHDAKEYSDLCANLAGDLSRLSLMRGQIRDRLTASFIGNATLVTRSLEEGYVRMWEDFVQRDRHLGGMKQAT